MTDWNSNVFISPEYIPTCPTVIEEDNFGIETKYDPTHLLNETQPYKQIPSIIQNSPIIINNNELVSDKISQINTQTKTHKKKIITIILIMLVLCIISIIVTFVSTYVSMKKKSFLI